MAIAFTAAATADITSAGNTLAFISFSSTAGQDIVVGVAMTNTANSVLSITDTAGNTYALKSYSNGTGVRVEVWEAHNILHSAANVILVTLQVSQTDLLTGVYGEYSTVSSVGNTNAATEGDTFVDLGIATQDGSNWGVVIFGFVSQSGDTLTAQVGTSRAVLVPSVTSVGIALYDNTQLAVGTLIAQARISTARNSASAGIELRSGGAAVPVDAYPPADAPVMQQNQDIGYLRVLMPLGGGGGILPPGSDGQIFPPAFVTGGA